VAQKVQTLLIDDLDGREAEGRCPLGLDGTDRGQVPAELVVKFQAAPESRSGRLPVIGLRHFTHMQMAHFITRTAASRFFRHYLSASYSWRPMFWTFCYSKLRSTAVPTLPSTF
jgi:hypothetical protein